jgi:hypothetical protein
VLPEILCCDAGLYQQAEYRYVYLAHQRMLAERAKMDIIPEHLHAYINAFISIMPATGVLAFFVDALQLNMITFVHNH